MELNEQNVVVEAVENAASEDFGKGFLVGGLATIGIGLGVKLVGRFVVKPLINKFVQKKTDAAWDEALDTMAKIREEKDDD